MAVFVLIASTTWVTQAGGNDHQPTESATDQHVVPVDGVPTHQSDPARDYDHCFHLNAHFVGQISVRDLEPSMISHRWPMRPYLIRAGIFPHILLRPPKALLSAI